MRTVISVGLVVLLLGGSALALNEKYFHSSGQILPGETWDNVYVYNDYTVVDMLGGQVGNLQTSGVSTFNMSGGQIIDSIDIGTLGQGTINISNGLVDIGDFVLREDSYTLILGGNITANRLKAYYDCTVDIKSGLLRLYSFDMVGFEELPTINIYGHGFNYNPTGGAYGDGLLTGYLLDDNFFSIDGLSESEFQRFNLIPEPSTSLLLGTGLIGLLARDKRIACIR